MGSVPSPVAYLLITWGLITVVLILLLIYRGMLSTREDDQLFLNKAEVAMMGGEQQILIGKLERLGKPIFWLATLSAALLVCSGGLWLWMGLQSS